MPKRCVYQLHLKQEKISNQINPEGSRILIYVSMLSRNYKACPSESGTEVGAPLFPAVELCDFPGRWQCMSGEIWCTLDSCSVLLTEVEAR